MNIFILILFFIFFISGMLSFISFEKLLSHQRSNYNAEWLKDGRPFLIWYINERPFWEFPFAGYKFYYKYVFVTPEWAKDDQRALSLFKFHRLYTSICYISFFIYAIVLFNK